VMAAEHRRLWSRFSRVHLSTPEEVRTYLALAREPRRSWSAEQIARIEGGDTESIRQALEGFAEAGIAVEVDAGKDHRKRYRWHIHHLGQLVGQPAGDDEVIDPICGMAVPARGVLSVTHDGQTFRFCSSLCRASFIALPSRFALFGSPGNEGGHAAGTKEPFREPGSVRTAHQGGPR
jgi:YHS domain-containing protein